MKDKLIGTISDCFENGRRIDIYASGKSKSYFSYTPPLKKKVYEFTKKEIFMALIISFFTSFIGFNWFLALVLYLLYIEKTGVVTVFLPILALVFWALLLCAMLEGGVYYDYCKGKRIKN
jgi:hypothetical protein